LLQSNLKQLIANKFGRAATHYDQAARLQRYAGEQLWKGLDLSKTLGVTLDLGCGTGLQITQLLQHSQQLLALDLSAGMLHHAKGKYTEGDIYWLRGDAETLPLADGSVDTVYSNLMVQWCNDLPAVLAEVRRVLRPGGKAVISTLLDGSLKELKSAWRSVDNFQHVNSFLSAEKLEKMLAAAGFTESALICDELILTYQRLASLTRELKSVGANVVTDEKRQATLGKQDIQKLLAGYEPFRLPNDQIPATYNIGIMKLTR
jgi:malonyl-CoA O-methyltransferase